MKKKVLIPHFVAGLAAALFIFITLPHNLSFTPDSMSYLEISGNISEGKGAVLDNGFLETHWAPFYSVMLAVTSILSGISTQYAGILLNGIALYAFILIFFYNLRELKINWNLALCLTLLLLISQPTSVFKFYLSEGLFLVFLLAGSLLFLKWIRRKKLIYLLIASFSFGLMYLTRYAAIGLIAGFGLYLLIDLIKNKNWRSFVTFLIGIFIILGPWILYTSSFEGDKRERIYYIDLISFEKIKSFFITIGYWFIGSYFARIIIPFLFLLNIFLVRNKLKELRKLPRDILQNYKPEVFLFFNLIATYLIFLVAAISLYNQSIPLDNRLLAPIYPFILMLLAMFLNKLKDNKEFNILLYSNLFFLLINSSTSIGPQWVSHYFNGEGYSKESWRQSEIIKNLSSQYDELNIYTNGIEIIELHTNFKSKLLPFKNDPDNWEMLKKNIAEGKSILVYFNDVDWRNYLVSGENILKEFRKYDILYFEDGFIIKSNR